jgi:glycosyltransferase involved in cell wall biosynthesis
MELTVCICTHDRPSYILQCLTGLARQTLSHKLFDILVVDSGSTGETPARLARLVATAPNARLIRVEQPGVSAARNAGAWACGSRYIAFIDDDAIPAPDWAASILRAIAESVPPPAVVGGRSLPLWEAPLPSWWPPGLRGVLSIIEAEGQGAYGDPHLPADLAPWAVNMVVAVKPLRDLGGFGLAAGRCGDALLSDEDVQLAFRMRQAGWPVRFDSRIVVHHQIQANRLTPAWLVSRLYWQGVSTVLTRRLLRHGAVWREVPRRLLVAALCAPAGLLPHRSTRLIGARWRLAYALGFIGAALGWYDAASAHRASVAPPSGTAATT